MLTFSFSEPVSGFVKQSIRVSVEVEQNGDVRPWQTSTVPTPSTQVQITNFTGASFQSQYFASLVGLGPGN